MNKDKVSKKTIHEFCTGCGLCKVEGINIVEKNNLGFWEPVESNKVDQSYCLASGKNKKIYDTSKLWGRSVENYVGWATDEKIREKASSGGILTQLAISLLRSGAVDGVIQTRVSDFDPTMTMTIISHSIEQIMQCCGSRYAISHPLQIIDKIELTKKYAFIGKPCDVYSLKMYIEKHKEYNQSIIYMFSFFCMGQPSMAAQKKLLLELGAGEDLESLNYRGNGWPGMTVAIKNGQKYSMKYTDSWGKILGRDLMKICHFCIDGIGECADVSCGDAWYLTPDNKPDFSEKLGRNVIIARTEKGNKLLHKLADDKDIMIEPYWEFEKDMPLIQKSQYERRIFLKSRILALKLFGKPYPHYDKRIITSYSKQVGFIPKCRECISTCRRILKGKI